MHMLSAIPCGEKRYKPNTICEGNENENTTLEGNVAITSTIIAQISGHQ
jgi:hypothetical protein